MLVNWGMCNNQWSPTPVVSTRAISAHITGTAHEPARQNVVSPVLSGTEGRHVLALEARVEDGLTLVGRPQLRRVERHLVVLALGTRLADLRECNVQEWRARTSNRAST